MRPSRFSTALSAVILFTGCAATHDQPSITEMLRDSTGQNGRACVRKHDIQGYGVLKNNVVSIDGRRGYYLATVLPGCHDLQTSARSIFSGQFGEVCGRSQDKIHTSDNSCVINQIFQFESRKQAFAVYDALLEQREQQADAASLTTE